MCTLLQTKPSDKQTMQCKGTLEKHHLAMAWGMGNMLSLVTGYFIKTSSHRIENQSLILNSLLYFWQESECKMLQPRTPTGQKLFVLLLLLQKCYSSKSISAAEETLMQSRRFFFVQLHIRRERGSSIYIIWSKRSPRETDHKL